MKHCGRVLILSIITICFIYTLTRRKGGPIRAENADHVTGLVDVHSVTYTRLLEVIRTPGNVMTFMAYMEKVRGRRSSTDDQIWTSMTHRQQDMLMCTNFNIASQLKGVSQIDYEPKAILYDYRYKNPCWSEQVSDREPYDPQAYLKPLKVEKYLRHMERHWSHNLTSHRLRCLPYLHVVGTGKCGSRDLYNLLKTHPQVHSGMLKEPRWWIRTRVGLSDTGTRHSVRTYADLYDGAAKNIINNFDDIIVDASVGTMYIADRWMLYPGNEGLSEPRVITAHHMKALIPHMKILILLREPVSRLYSHYKEDWGSGATPDGFQDEVMKAVTSLEECMSTRSLRKCLYDPCVNRVGSQRRIKLRASIYYVYIRDWLTVFDRDHVLISTLEDYHTSRVNVFDKLTNFIGINKFSQDMRVNLTKVEPKRPSGGDPMLPETEQFLTDFFKPFNNELVNLLKDLGYNLNISCWSME